MPVVVLMQLKVCIDVVPDKTLCPQEAQLQTGTTTEEFSNTALYLAGGVQKTFKDFPANTPRQLDAAYRFGHWFTALNGDNTVASGKDFHMTGAGTLASGTGTARSTAMSPFRTARTFA